MAGDWIKMRGNLWDDPRVARICDLTDSTEAAVIGGLYWLWASADQHSTDGVMEGLSLRAIDRKTGIQGLAAALVTIGWLAEEPEGVRILRFEEHNGQSAKTRAVTAKRVANHKAANAASVTESEKGNGDSVTQALAPRYLEKEKEKENKNTAPAKPAAALRAGDLVTLGVPEQVAVDFLAVRKAKRAPLTRTALDAIQREAEKAKVSLGDALAVCAARGWQSLKADWLTNNPAPVQPAPADPVSPYRRFQS